MRRPPPLTRFVHYPITAGVGIAAILVTVLKLAGRSIDPFVMNVLAFEGEPWRVVSSALPHGSLIHLVFNLCWLWIFGTAIEGVWGPVRTAMIFVVFAVPSALVEYAVLHGGIGLSGVGYGQFGLLWVVARRDPRFAGVLDVKTTRLFVAWFFLCIVLTVTEVMMIGNVAHGVGGVTGVLLGYAIVEGRRAARFASGAALAALVVAATLGASTFRPVVNFSVYGGADSAVLGHALLDGVHTAEAVHHLRRAVEINEDDDASWYNLGVALETLEAEPEAALRAYRRAYALSPSDLHRDGLARVLVRRGIERAEVADAAGAIPLYAEGVAIAPAFVPGWWNLSLAYAEAARWDEAIDAARKAYALDETAITLFASALEDAGADADARGDAASALELYREAVTLRPRVELYMTIYRLLVASGREAEAEAVLPKAVELGEAAPDEDE